MGSRTKTVSDLQSMRMFKEEDNLFSQDLIRIYARLGTLEADKLLPPLIQDSTTFFNEKVFEALGATSEITMEIIDYSDESVLSYIQTVDPSATEVSGSGTVDNNAVQVNSDILKTRDLLAGYTTVPGHTQVASQSLTFTTTGSYTAVYEGFEYIGETLVVQMSGGLPNTGYNSVTEEAYIVCDNITTGGVTNVVVPADNRTVYAVEYVSGGVTKYGYLYTQALIGEATTENAFMLVMKSDFVMTGEEGDPKRQFLYARFGLNAEDEDGDTLETSLENADIKDGFLTYAINRYDEDFGDMVDKYYTGNNVTVVGDISFSYTTSMGLGETDGNKYEIKYGEEQYPCDVKDENDEWMPMYIIPLSAINALPMYKKFEIYNKMFCMFVFAESEVEVKWYQTVLFRFIMMVVALILAVVTAGTASAAAYNVMMTIGGSIAGSLLSMIDPRIAAVIGIVVAVISMGSNTGNLFNQVLNVANKVLETVMTFNQVAFQDKMQLMADQAEKMREDTKEAEDELADMMRQPLYINFSDKVEYQYNGLFEMVYNTPDMVYNSVNPESYMPQY